MVVLRIGDHRMLASRVRCLIDNKASLPQLKPRISEQTALSKSETPLRIYQRHRSRAAALRPQALTSSEHYLPATFAACGYTGPTSDNRRKFHSRNFDC